MKAPILGAGIAAVLAFSGSADAYPQFQLVKDQTCWGCHIAPNGGGLLNENGLNTAESISQFGTAPEVFYGKIPTPSWLLLGGDPPRMTGYIQTPEKSPIPFPKQAQLSVDPRVRHLPHPANSGPPP